MLEKSQFKGPKISLNENVLVNQNAILNNFDKKERGKTNNALISFHAHVHQLNLRKLHAENQRLANRNVIEINIPFRRKYSLNNLLTPIQTHSFSHIYIHTPPKIYNIYILHTDA